MQSIKAILSIPSLLHRIYLSLMVVPKRAIHPRNRGFPRWPPLAKYKFFFILLFGVLLLLYFMSDVSFFNRQKHYIRTSSLNECLKDRLSVFQAKINTLDAAVFHTPLLEGERKFFPFIGNGYFGASWEGSGQLHLQHDRTLSLPTNLFPLFSLKVPDYQHSEANVIDFKDGTVSKMQCFKLSSLCISTGITAYAHRTRPGLLVQDIKIYNPTNRPVGVRIERVGQRSRWEGASVQNMILPSMKAPRPSYKLTVGTVPISDNRVYLLAVAEPSVPEVVTVKMTDNANLRLVTAIRYSGPMPARSVNESAKQALIGAVKEALVGALRKPQKELQEEHTNAWNRLWHTGLTLSYSLAPNALNGDRINATLFYLLSSTAAPLHRANVSKAERDFAAHSLLRIDQCYIGHNTLLANNLWTPVPGMREVADLVTHWRITLEKQGCTRLLKAGADGLIQAVLLSLGGFHFYYDRLEFNMHPNELHRDFTFRNIFFPISGHELTVAVELDEGNRALLYVTAAARPGNTAHGKLFACDAVCVTPVELSKARSQLPIKITRPQLSIMYVSSKLNHLQNLRLAIHVTDVRDAPAHAHHVISLHRHGHALGGLPMLFWILLISLVLIFHLFLIKLVYNEYCKGQANIAPFKGPPAYRNYRYHV